MKRCLSLLAALLLILCSCSKEEPEKIKTADMLNITNTEESFNGCRERLSSVLTAMKSKVSVLEAEHNRSIKIENPAEFFLDKNYIHTAFEPFLLNSGDIADGFTTEMTAETAKSFYSLYVNNEDIIYESDGKTNYLLKFVSEDSVREFSAEYNKKADSFRYIVKTENDGGELIEEFLEFVKLSDSTYVMQSQKERCYIEFNEEDEIVSFYCGELRDDTFLLDESIFPAPDVKIDKHWVLSRGKSQFSNIHVFEDGILTHEDCSSGPWKSIKIVAKNYESAFYSHF